MNTRLQSLVKLVGMGITLLSIYYLFFLLQDNIDDFLSSLSQLTPLNTYPSIIFSLLTLILGHAIAVYAWCKITTLKGYSLNYRAAFSILGKAQIAKYLPGNIAHLVSRAILFRDQIKLTDLSIFIVIETTLIAIIAIVIGISGLNRLAIAPEYSNVLPALFIFPLLLLIFVTLTKDLNASGGIGKTVRTLSTPTLLLTLSFFLHGLALYFISTNLFDTASTGYLIFVYAFATSFVVGYITPGSPGGIGVRESLFIFLMADIISNTSAMQTIFFYRCISIFSDIIIFLISTAFAPKSATH